MISYFFCNLSSKKAPTFREERMSEDKGMASVLKIVLALIHEI